MGRLVAVVRLDDGPIDRAIVDRWRKGASGFKPARVRAGACWAFAQETLPFAANEPVEPQPFELKSGALLFAEARIDERNRLAAQLGAGRTDPGLLAASIDAAGLSACESVHGEFALAHWHEAERTLTLARDALGQRALFYHFDGSAVYFATALHLLLAIPQVPREIDELGIADLLVGATDAPERTLYRDILRVPAGGMAIFRPGECRTRHYWNAADLPDIRFRRDEDYVEAARALFDQAVASRLPATGRLATTLSGGFDSAAATATAARMFGDRRLTAFTRVSGVPHPYRGRLDDREFAGKVAAMYANIDWVVVDELYQADRDTESTWESARMGVPTNAFARSWSEAMHKRAEAIGARVLLVGNMGNSTLSWSGDCLTHEQIRSGRWIGAVADVIRTARREQRPVGNALRLRLGGAIEPGALRRWRRRRSDARRWPCQQWVALSPDFLADIDYGAHMQSDRHENLDGVTMSGKALRAASLLTEGQIDQYAYLRGEWRFEMLDPFLDRKLVEFTLGIPETQYARKGMRRWLARRVLADRLPAELLAQTKRGRQMGEWYHLANLRRDHTVAAVERLAHSPLASRVLDMPRLKKLAETWPKDAEAAKATEGGHRIALHQGVVIGSFLSWFEGNNG